MVIGGVAVVVQPRHDASRLRGGVETLVFGVLLGAVSDHYWARVVCPVALST